MSRDHVKTRSVLSPAEARSLRFFKRCITCPGSLRHLALPCVYQDNVGAAPVFCKWDEGHLENTKIKRQTCALRGRNSAQRHTTAYVFLKKEATASWESRRSLTTSNCPKNKHDQQRTGRLNLPSRTRSNLATTKTWL